MIDVPKQRRSSRGAAPRDVPLDASPDENRGPAATVASPAAGVSLSPAALARPAPPPPKRARTASAGEQKSFAGAKNFIAQLQKAEAVDALAAAVDDEPADEPALLLDDARAALSTGGAKMPPDDGALIRSSPHPSAGDNLDASEEDAARVLSGMFEDDTPSQALSDAGTAHAGAKPATPKRRRTGAAMSAGPASPLRPKAAAAAAAARAARAPAAAAAPSPSRAAARRVVGSSPARDAVVRVSSPASAPSSVPAAGPSASRKAADHRRLLKSYMKALFRHLKLPVEVKFSEDVTYRDRINGALEFWFGDSFAPGRATIECNAPKIFAAIVYLATKGRVTVGPEDVADVLRKGVQAKNANYAVNEAALLARGARPAELRALFEGPPRVDDDGFPRGTPLILPDLDHLPAPREGTKPGAAAAAAEGDGCDRGKRNENGGEKGKKNGGEPFATKPSSGGREDPRETLQDPRDPLQDLDAPRVDEDGPSVDAERHEGVATTPANPPRRRAGGHGAGADEDEGPPPADASRRVSSPLFSPVGGVTAAFAAAALMPAIGDRSAEVTAFVEGVVRPMLDGVAGHPTATQLEMLNCAQGEITRRATELAREQHEAARREGKGGGGWGGKRKR